MKRLLLTVLIAATGLLLAGCLVRTTEPWLADGTRVTSPALGGAWQDANAKLTAFFSPQGSNYQVRVVQDGKETSLFTASLHQAGGKLLLMVGPAAPSSRMDVFVQMPVFLLFRATVADDTLQLFTLNLDAVPDRIRASSLAPAFTGSKDKAFLLTSPTADLETFVRAQIDTPDFFRTEALYTFKKMVPATIPPPL